GLGRRGDRRGGRPDLAAVAHTGPRRGALRSVAGPARRAPPPPAGGPPHPPPPPPRGPPPGGAPTDRISSPR
ncbi:hypothetical protein, partial [Nocardia abscessus]|uniref:hypothetical protein n=1 Tax=Nocardia abscessus TaxID=120957 RepID=UPI002456351E